MLSGVARETADLAGGVDALVARAAALCDGGDDDALEVASHLLDLAAVVAEDDVRVATRALHAAMGGEGGGGRASRGGLSEGGEAFVSADAYDAFTLGNGGRSSGVGRGEGEEAAALRRTSASLDAVLRVGDAVAARLSGRLVEDEWRATIAAFASQDWLRDKKKPRVRPKDRRGRRTKPTRPSSAFHAP